MVVASLPISKIMLLKIKQVDCLFLERCEIECGDHGECSGKACVCSEGWSGSYRQIGWETWWQAECDKHCVKLNIDIWISKWFSKLFFN